jgi:hypothetical protein
LVELSLLQAGCTWVRAFRSKNLKLCLRFYSLMLVPRLRDIPWIERDTGSLVMFWSRKLEFDRLLSFIFGTTLKKLKSVPLSSSSRCLILSKQACCPSPFKIVSAHVPASYLLLIKTGTELWMKLTILVSRVFSHVLELVSGSK